MLRVVLLSLIFACSQTDEERVKEAMLSAKIQLNTKQCDDAINILESVGRQNTNSKYLQILASAYACKADYNELDFYGTNISRLSSTQTGMFGSLTTFTSSAMTGTSDPQFTSLQTAINILLLAGGLTSPSSANRRNVFSDNEVNTMDLQNLYMILSQLGKYLYFYGNANPITGKKGDGEADNGNTNGFTNGCLYDYNPIDGTLATVIAVARASGTLGSCNTTATGNPKLPALPNNTTTRRMCSAIVLFNNMLNILSSISVPNSGDSLSELNTVFGSVCSSESSLGTICSVLSQSECEEDFSSTSGNTDVLQSYFFLLFESLFL